MSSRQCRLEAERDSAMRRAATIVSWEYLTIPRNRATALAATRSGGLGARGDRRRPGERLLYLKRPIQSLTARVTTEQRNRYYVSRGLDPERSPQRDST